MKDERRRLDDPRTVNRIVYGLYVLCGLWFLADLLYTKHPHFDMESFFGFYAIYGFIGSVTLVLVAKQLRRVLMRGEDYYEGPERGNDDD
ncbi:LMBR1 domain-containing protein [Actinomadura sp. WMMB 499]|uniref:LMBR1 domain-containing protein n=1 Tax=Actinomadura sp. WMMB 499 TaxID=1219491 RepID=UPI001244243B|nr:LMBR1 domain-containing protein [Actinomadura sp. WMMB 499]QFG24601.1 LMBR1 domain-containing protein [Actinomadura sp. WMMB 499]